MYVLLNGKWGEYTEEQVITATPEEDRPYLNKYYRVDKPVLLTDEDDLVEKIADSIRPYSNALSYSIAVLQDGVRKIYCRPTNPCLGNLTKYKDDYPDHGEFNVTKPGDLYYVFPEGQPIGISIFVAPVMNEYHNDLLVDSPVSEALKGSTIVHDEGGRRNILVQSNMEIDPNVFWMGLKWMMRVTPQDTRSEVYSELKKNLGAHQAISLLAWAGRLGYGQWASFSRLLNKNPHRISKGKYSDGYGYTRSNCEYIFSTKKLKYGTDKFYNSPVNEEDEGGLSLAQVKTSLKINNAQFDSGDYLRMYEYLMKSLT